MRFDAEKVVALKMENKTRRLEIHFTDEQGAAHIVSLPIPIALELAQFIADVCSFMKRLKRRPGTPPQN